MVAPMILTLTSPSEGELGVSLVDGPHLLVGGRNRVYKLGLEDLVVQKTLDWGASEQVLRDTNTD